MADDKELAACKLATLSPKHFNPKCSMPYGCTVDHVRQAMHSFLEFLEFVNTQLHSRDIARFETMLMAANFSSMVGEFMSANIPKYCAMLAKNQYHNGHPDLIPKGKFPKDAVQYCHEGIEVKASRYLKGWQGHNPEEVFLMVFVFDANRARDEHEGVPPKPFRFLGVYGAQLTKEDWLFAGRSATSRRTITASVTESGHKKMLANWLYQAPSEQLKLLRL